MDRSAVCVGVHHEEPPAAAPEPAGSLLGERRRNPRHNHYFPITFSSDGAPGTPVIGAGITVNLSEGGAFFVLTDTRLFPGMKLCGTIIAKTSQVDGGIIEFAARVLRVSTFALGDRTVEATVGVAVQFDGLMGELRLEPVRNPAPWETGPGPE